MRPGVRDDHILVRVGNKVEIADEMRLIGTSRADKVKACGN